MKPGIAAFLLHIARRKEMNEDADGRDMHHHHGGKAVDVKSELEYAVPRRGEQRKVDDLRSPGDDVIEKIKREAESENFGEHTDPRDLLTHQTAKRADDKARQSGATNMSRG